LERPVKDANAASAAAVTSGERGADASSSDGSDPVGSLDNTSVGVVSLDTRWPVLPAHRRPDRLHIRERRTEPAVSASHCWTG
jgi:hypothetical protein